MYVSTFLHSTVEEKAAGELLDLKKRSKCCFDSRVEVMYKSKSRK